MPLRLTEKGWPGKSGRWTGASRAAKRSSEDMPTTGGSGGGASGGGGGSTSMVTNAFSRFFTCKFGGTKKAQVRQAAKAANAVKARGDGARAKIS